MKKLLTSNNLLLTTAGILLACAIAFFFPAAGLGALALLGLTSTGGTLAQQIKGMKEDRALKLKLMDELVNRADKRSFTDSEQNSYNDLKREVEKLSKEIADLEDQQLRDARTARPFDSFDSHDNNIDGLTMMRSGKKNNEKVRPAFTYYRKKQSDDSGINAVQEFVKRNYNFDTAVAALSPGEVIRAYLCGPSNNIEERALSEGTTTAGGFTVPVITSAAILDNVRAKSHVINAGATVVLLDSNDESIAKIVGDPTPSWLAENAAITPTDITFGRVRFLPKANKLTIKSSIELMQDSLNMGQAIDLSITGAFAREWDRTALVGSGSGQEPKGIFNYTSPSVHEVGVNGAQVDYDDLLDGIKAMLDNNCPYPNTAIMAPRTWRKLMSQKDLSLQYVQKPQFLENIKMLESTGVPTNQDQGTATGIASCIFFGGFENLYLGQRLGVTIYPTTESLASDGQLSFFAMSRIDWQPFREQSFGLVKGIIE